MNSSKALCYLIVWQMIRIKNISGTILSKDQIEVGVNVAERITASTSNDFNLQFKNFDPTEVLPISQNIESPPRPSGILSVSTKSPSKAPTRATDLKKTTASISSDVNVLLKPINSANISAKGRTNEFPSSLSEIPSISTKSPSNAPTREQNKKIAAGQNN
jgi:hypothetical protein